MLAHRLRSAPLHAAFALVFALVASAGCTARSDAIGSQVVARVGGGEITVHQVEQLLATAPDGDEASARRAALESLIDRQLIAERARAEGLDRDPAVLALLETARRQLLAQAWIDRRFALLPEPDEPALRAAYDARPHAHARRRAYVIDELIVPADAIDARALQEAAERARGPAETAAWLKSRGLPHQRRLGASTSDQMPDALALMLAPMREGAVATVRDTGMLRVLWILQARTQPASFDEARPQLARRLIDASRETALADTLQALRAATPVAYADRAAGPAAADAAAPRSLR